MILYGSISSGKWYLICCVPYTNDSGMSYSFMFSHFVPSLFYSVFCWLLKLADMGCCCSLLSSNGNGSSKETEMRTQGGGEGAQGKLKISTAMSAPSVVSDGTKVRQATAVV